MDKSSRDSLPRTTNITYAINFYTCNPVDLVQIDFWPPARREENSRKTAFGPTQEMEEKGPEEWEKWPEIPLVGHFGAIVRVIFPPVRPKSILRLFSSPSSPKLICTRSTGLQLYLNYLLISVANFSFCCSNYLMYFCGLRDNIPV